jgi:hypothetical protein
MLLGQRAMQALKCATHGLKDRRDGRELSIVEPHVNISAISALNAEAS